MLARISLLGNLLERAVLDLLYPPRCVACRRPGEYFCADCRTNLVRIEPPWCDHCGRPLTHHACIHCQQSPLQMDGMRACAFFEGPIREAIHAFKYQHRTELAPLLAGVMHEFLLAHPIPMDVLVPVPLHLSRERERGYNQSRLLASELGVYQRLPVWYNRLERKRATPPQVGLNANDRRENMRDAFGANGSVAGARILLIDDVCTTGATMEACSIALKACGAHSVWGLALARGR